MKSAANNAARGLVGVGVVAMAIWAWSGQAAAGCAIGTVQATVAAIYLWSRSPKSREHPLAAVTRLFLLSPLVCILLIVVVPAVRPACFFAVWSYGAVALWFPGMFTRRGRADVGPNPNHADPHSDG